jgi:hypothetical protein
MPKWYNNIMDKKDNSIEYWKQYALKISYKALGYSDQEIETILKKPSTLV